MLFFTLLFSLFFFKVKADLGSCVVYHAKFYLKNGEVFNACFEVFGYGEEAALNQNGTNPYCNDKGVFHLLKTKQRMHSDTKFSTYQKHTDKGKIAVFKKFYYVQPRPIQKIPSEYLPKYGLVTPSDIIFIDSNEISKLIFWDAEYTKREWLTSEIIVGTQGMADSINQQKYWNALETPPDGLAGNYNYYEGGYEFYNYNPQINMAEMKRLIRLKFSETQETALQNFKRVHHISEMQELPLKLQQLFEKEYIQKEEARKRWFWRKGILMVEVNGTC